MKTLPSMLALSAGLFTVRAADTFFSASLDPSQEHAGTSTRSGLGSGDFTLSNTTLSYTISYSGLSGNSTAAHIHGPAAPGVDAGVLFPLSGTLGGTSGTLSGTIPNLTPAQISDLNNGLWYANVHSTTFGGGEIRGQITLVPEPGTMALIAAAGGLMIALRRKRA